jgi:hypothetical protein
MSNLLTRTLLTAMAISSCVISALHAETRTPVLIPYAQLDHYRAKETTERVELMALDRLQLIGPQTIQMDRLNDYNVTTEVQDSSATFTHIHTSDIQFLFYSFPSSAFKHSFSVATINAYLDNLSRTKPPEANFEILELAQETTGKAKFRIFGNKALTTQYAIDMDDRRFIVADNWIEEDGNIYMISVITPEKNFAPIFKSIRKQLNSMYIVE